MIASIWQSYALECGVLWAMLAGIWLWAQPENARWLDRLYPLAPFAVFAIVWMFPQATESLNKYLQLGICLWVWLTVVWVISLLKRDASIMDIAYGFVLLCGTWWLFVILPQHRHERAVVGLNNKSFRSFYWINPIEIQNLISIQVCSCGSKS